MTAASPPSALESLRGLSVGDAFGEQVMWQGLSRRVAMGRDPSPPWRWTDDTALAIAQVRELQHNGSIAGRSLAARMADTYRADPNRGFGAGMHRLFPRFLDGESWEQASAALFEGQGSFGNGAAMRMAPLGAWFAAPSDDQTDGPTLDLVIDQATRGSRVTHAHPEGIAGGVAIAVTAAQPLRSAATSTPPAPSSAGSWPHAWA